MNGRIAGTFRRFRLNSEAKRRRGAPDFAERFPTAKHFASWLGVCPDNRITGGKIMSSSTRDVKSRAATALRAAQGLNRAQNYFGDLYRRWKARLGTPKAITAMAHT